MKRLPFVAFLLIISGIFVASNIYTLLPIYKFVALDLHISSDQVVLGSSVFSLFYACGLLSFGPISEKMGRKRVIVGGLFFSYLTTVLVGFAWNEGTLYLFRGIQGFALGSFAPVAFAYTFELFPQQQRTLVLALINSGFLIAGILGQLISSKITTLYRWEYVYYCFGIIYLILFLCGLRVLPDTSKEESSQHRSICKDMLSLFRKPSLVYCYVITFTILLAFVAFYDGLGRFLTTQFHMDQETLFTIRAIGLVGASLSLFTGAFVKKWGAKQTLLIGLLLSASSLVLLLLFHTPVMLAIFSIPFVAALSLLYPSIISLIGTLGEHARGSAISWYSFILLLGASIGPIIASILDFSTLLLCLIGLFVGNFILSLKLRI